MRNNQAMRQGLQPQAFLRGAPRQISKRFAPPIQAKQGRGESSRRSKSGLIHAWRWKRLRDSLFSGSTLQFVLLRRAFKTPFGACFAFWPRNSAGSCAKRRSCATSRLKVKECASSTASGEFEFLNEISAAENCG